jgi:CDP-4-dehydro-6-deoxyglucose reductase, E1
LPNLTDEQLKQKILDLTREWSRRKHSTNLPGSNPHKPKFIPGETPIPYAARTFTEEEVVAATSSTLDFWLTLGAEGEAMERELAQFLGIRKSLLVNSGSSANLIALSTLTSHLADKDKRLLAGDEIITCAAGFPTTVAPIIQNRLAPVFLDADRSTGNIKTDLLEEAYLEGKTKAVMLAHTLGNPFNLSIILEFCKKYNLWLIEDNCDALGCSYTMPKKLANNLGYFSDSLGIGQNENQITRWTGTWGDLSTQSFYPPHHLTMGEGGAVNISGNLKLKRPAESFRDWGRDCYCQSGKDDTCNKRFSWQLGELPVGYDHKFIYSHLGYNMKPLDIQAAIGRVQLKRLPDFIAERKKNWEYLRKGLSGLEDYFEFALPEHATSWTEEGFTWDESGCRTECSWFGFMLKVRTEAPFTKSELAQNLDENKIGNRMLFGGNLLRQPAFIQLKKDRPDSFRIVGNLDGADQLMQQALFLGTYPGLNKEMLDYEIEIIHNFTNKLRNLK